jgi:hypothetical protein
MTVGSHLSVTAGGGAHRRVSWAAGEARLLGLRGPRSGPGRETRGPGRTLADGLKQKWAERVRREGKKRKEFYLYEITSNN